MLIIIKNLGNPKELENFNNFNYKKFSKNVIEQIEIVASKELIDVVSLNSVYKKYKTQISNGTHDLNQFMKEIEAIYKENGKALKFSIKLKVHSLKIIILIF